VFFRCSLALLTAVMVVGNAAAHQPPPGAVPPVTTKPDQVRVEQAPRDSAPGVTGDAVIRGKITAAADGHPLHRVRVVLNGSTPNLPTAVTDERGAFELTEVPPGTYTITASRAGYLTTRYGQRRPLEPGRSVAISSGETVDGVDIRLARGATLAGRIADDAGEPYRTRAPRRSSCGTCAAGGWRSPRG